MVVSQEAAATMCVCVCEREREATPCRCVCVCEREREAAATMVSQESRVHGLSFMSLTLVRKREREFILKIVK